MPTLPSTHDETKPSAQMNLLDRLAGAIGSLVATRPVHFIALLGLCAAYIQGGLTKLFDFNAAVGETQSFGLPFAAAATEAPDALVVHGPLVHRPRPPLLALLQAVGPALRRLEGEVSRTASGLTFGMLVDDAMLVLDEPEGATTPDGFVDLLLSDVAAPVDSTELLPA